MNENENKSILENAGIETGALIKRTFLALEDGDFQEADKYLEQVLNQEPENAKAYLGKLMIEKKVRTVDELTDKVPSLGDERLFNRALHFADDEYKSELEGYLKRIRDKADQKRADDKAKFGQILRRADIAIEEGEFNEAKEYLDSVLYQSPENSQAYFLTLMAERRVHSVDELTELPIALEREKLFQQAMKYAGDSEKAQLESYVQLNLEKAEQRKAEEIARIERERAEREAEKERRYQEILNLKEKASKINEFNKIIDLLNALKPYKDTEKIYNEVQKSLEIEKKYQEVLNKKRDAQSSINWRFIVTALNDIKGYKDTEELLSQAQNALSEAEAREAKTRKTVIISLFITLMIAAAAFGVKKYIERAERIAREKAIEEARIARENIMIAFFNGKHDEAYGAINALANSADNPVLLNMLAYIDYDKYDGKNYKQLRDKALQVSKNNPDASKNFYSEAFKLSENYLSQPSANKFIGDVYLNGFEVKKDYKKAIEHFTIPAENGDLYSQLILAELYNNMNNKNEAIKWYQKLADNGDNNAQIKVADMFYELKNYKRAAEAYLKLAENGSAESLKRLGDIYYNGQGVEKDHNKALEFYTKSAEQDNAEALNSLGDMYYNGQGVEKDYNKALEFYAKAANQGSAAAQNNLGDMYYRGQGVEKDYNKAVEFYAKAAERGNAAAQNSLGDMYYNAQGVTQDDTKALEFYAKAANQGNAAAQNSLGDIYYSGHGVEKDYKKAVEFYTKSAEQGNVAAQNKLGDMYYSGHGVTQDYKKALEWYTKSANQGNADAQNSLGYMYYYNSYGVKQDYKKALEWYTKSANQGNAAAQKSLGDMYYYGYGVKKDLNEAKKWYQKAEAQGNISAKSALSDIEQAEKQQAEIKNIENLYITGNQYLEAKDYQNALKYFRLAAEENYAPAQDKLGWMYQKGWGVIQDYDTAAEWYRKAANQGNLAAQASLGLFYYNGWGVEKNLNTALEWYKKSAAQGYAVAIKQAEMIEREIYNIKNQRTFAEIDYQGDFPVAASIFGNRVNVRSSPTIHSYSMNMLNAGHPVSVSRRSSQDDGDWMYVKTASGTQGWVRGDYVALNNNVSRTEQEISNRKVSLPARGRVTVIRTGAQTVYKINLRHIPSTSRSSKVVSIMSTGDEFIAYEIFAEEDRDWYRIRNNYNEEGWISGRFINLY